MKRFLPMVLLFAPVCVAADLALTPPMGWNSWNKFAEKIDDKTVREIADAIVSSGMKDAGYVYVNIDDTWEAGRDAQGNIQTNSKFPDMKALADYVHSKGLKIGIPREYFIEGMDREVEDSVRAAVRKLETLGAIPVEVSLPHTGYAIAVYYILATSEASSNLARYDGVKYGFRAPGGEDLLDMYMRTRSMGFGAEVKRRIMLGTYALSSGYYEAYYGKAQQVRTLIKRDFEEAFKKADIIATPTSPTAAFRVGEKVQDPLQMYLSDIFTISINLAGIPAISIPCGFTKDNLPVGLQLIGKHFDEETVLRAAYAYEQSTEWHRERPPL
jgi:aspartyl-tRNA(Asn)/glutamyl-tRNA(Gln) amidotransferase subunit A